MEQGLDIKALLRAFLRRWLLILAPVVLLTPVAMGIAFILPPVYSSTARILVESQQIPTELAQSTVTVDVAQRIALIEQRLMTRENLLTISDKFAVTANRGPMSPTEIVDLMRASTNIRGVRLSGDRGPVTGVDITFQADRARTAADVANEFLTLLLEQNLRQRNQRATETSAYFRQEVARLGQEMSQLEARIADFKIENKDALPDSLSFRRTELTDLEQRIFEREMRVIALDEERTRLQEALDAGAPIAGGTASPEEQELDRLRRTLLQQRSIYADSHPVVRATLSRISTIEALLAKGAANGAEGAADDGGVMAAATQRRREIERTIGRINTQLDALEERRVTEEARMQGLRDSIARTPSVELALNDLERRYGALQTQYQGAVSKLAQAETGERLEVNQQAERFEVIEQAQVPVRPVSPNRPLIAAAGFVGSLGLGVGLALLLELMNRSIRSASDLERALDMRPIVTVPYITTRRERLRKVWTVRVAALLALVVIPAGLFYVDQRVVPLPLLAERLIDRVGAKDLVALVESRFNR